MLILVIRSCISIKHPKLVKQNRKLEEKILAEFDNIGFSMFPFTKPGVYDYYCKLHPYQHGRINVGDQVQTGANIDMRIDGKRCASSLLAKKRFKIWQHYS